jgi:DNA-binding response OmpR family regulator
MKGQHMNETLGILVVDDDPLVCDLLQDYLGEQGFAVRLAMDSRDLRQALDQQVPDVVVLDVNLPGEDGLSLARFLREHHDLPVIMISGAGSVLDRIVGLEVGADDYLVKPFEPRELLTRIKTVLRRYQRSATPTAPVPQPTLPSGQLRVGPFVLDLDQRMLRNARQQEIPLTSMEFDLLEVLARRPGRPLSRDQLLNLTQNRDWSPFDRSIDIRITRLRSKLESDPDKPRLIRTVRGIGYMLVNDNVE